ncbi:DUF6894 family protein [Bradyrhizobium japonicum]|uniref:DUF6894 family protein n=1 Tax=Bradyrhizobium japonicum TaxID=375 RepID=UPI0035DC261F
MTRYYFDLFDGDEVAVDEEGLELSSLRADRLKQPKRSPTWRGMRWQPKASPSETWQSRSGTALDR